MLRIGLTGGIASGKSTAAYFFSALHVPIIDTDHLARTVTEARQPLTQRICAEFGSEICQEDGTLNRKALRSLVFSNLQLRKKLESLLHPVIAEAMEVKINHYRTSNQKPDYILLVIPLLLEAGWQNRVDHIVVIDCRPEEQIKRLLERDGIPTSLAHQMLAAQTTREQRLAKADFIITNYNTTTRPCLQQQVQAIDLQLRSTLLCP